MTEVDGVHARRTHAAFVEAHEHRLRCIVDHVAIRYRLSPHDREDLFQETMARLCAVYADIADPAAAFQYVEKIAERVAIDDRRRVRVRDDAWLELVHRHHSTVPADPADAVIQHARIRSVRGALRRLPAPQRHALVLAEFAELSTADGAAAMQITPTAFKGLLQRGRERLRLDLRNAPGVVAAIRAWRPKPTVPLQHVATSFVGVAAWCAVLVRPEIVVLPHVRPIAVVPAEAHHGAVPATVVVSAPVRPATAAQAVPRRLKTAVTPQRERTRAPSAVPEPPQVCVGTNCIGDTKHGDELCVTDGQGHNVSCTKQSQVAICEHVPHSPYATCERHGNPDWIVPPPP